MAKQLVEAITAAVEERGLPWQPVMNKGYVAIQRPGSYNVLVIGLLSNHPRLGAKFPDHPTALGLDDPYPDLQQVWAAAERELSWIITPDKPIPDVGVLIDLVRPYHPKRGAMGTTGEQLDASQPDDSALTVPPSRSHEVEFPNLPGSPGD